MKGGAGNQGGANSGKTTYQPKVPAVLPIGVFKHPDGRVSGKSAGKWMPGPMLSCGE
jgi:hypothetical protein